MTGTAAHAGASTRKTRHLQPNASNAADAKGGLFCLFQTRFPHSSTLQVGGKPAALLQVRAQNNHHGSVPGVRVQVGPGLLRYCGCIPRMLCRTVRQRWSKDRLEARANGLDLWDGLGHWGNHQRDSQGLPISPAPWTREDVDKPDVIVSKRALSSSLLIWAPSFC